MSVAAAQQAELGCFIVNDPSTRESSVIMCVECAFIEGCLLQLCCARIKSPPPQKVWETRAKTAIEPFESESLTLQMFSSNKMCL